MSPLDWLRFGSGGVAPSTILLDLLLSYVLAQLVAWLYIWTHIYGASASIICG